MNRLLSILCIVLTVCLSHVWAQPTHAISNAAPKNSTTTHTPSAQASSPTLINQTIAIVNNDVITSQELSQGVTQMIAQLRGAGAAIPNQLDLERQVLQQLILKKLALQLAAKNNIQTTHLEVNQAIDGILAENHTTLPDLKAQLERLGVSYKAYRENLATQLTINKLQQQAVAGSIYISPKEITAYMKKHLGAQDIVEYDVQHILLPLPQSPSPEQIAKAKGSADKIIKEIKSKKLTFDEAAAKYSQSGDALNGGKLGWKSADQLPTIFASKVTSMKDGEILPPFEAGGNLHILYLVNSKSKKAKQHYITQYNVSQIVIKTSPVVSNQQAKAQLERIINDLQNGVKFKKLAKSNSQNYDNADKGGEMGWIALTSVPFAVAKQIESTAVGQYSQPFQVDNSWQIIKVNDKRSKNDTEDYLKQQAANALFQEKAQQAVKTWMASLRNSAYVKILNPKLEMPTL